MDPSDLRDQIAGCHASVNYMKQFIDSIIYAHSQDLIDFRNFKKSVQNYVCFKENVLLLKAVALKRFEAFLTSKFAIVRPNPEVAQHI